MSVGYILLNYALLLVPQLRYVIDEGDAPTSTQVSRLANPNILVCIRSLLTASEMLNELFVVIRKRVCSRYEVIDFAKHSSVLLDETS